MFVWDLESGTMIRAIPHAWEIRASAISPDDTTLVTGQLGGPDGKQEPTVFVWDLATGRALQTLTHLAPCSDISFSPDGVLFALGFIDGEASIIRQLLETYGIPCQVISDIPHTVMPLSVDGLGEIRILVPTSRLDEARSLIAEYRRDGMRVVRGGKGTRRTRTDDEPAEGQGGG